MGMTNFYQGSLRYSPCGRKRKNHMANPVKKKPIQFKKMKAALEKGDWKEAAKEGRDSKWYKQVTKRAERLMTRLENIS